MNVYKNKPERVFDLQVRYRELDILKIRNFWEIVWKFFGFSGIFGGIFLDIFGGFSFEEFFVYIVKVS